MLGRLRFAVRRAYVETDYYRELFDEIGFDPAADFSFEEYAGLPVLSREDVAAAGRGLISRVVPPAQLQKDSTGGSTGKPTEVWIGPEEKGWRESAIETFMQSLEAPSGTRVAFFWGHHLDPVKSDGLRDRWYSFATNVRWFDCFRLSPEALDLCHDGLRRWSPACIIAYASALGQLAEHLFERGDVATYPSRCMVTGGEKLLPHHRQAIETSFERPVHERYGSRDVGPIGLQMDPTRSLDYEIDWANLLVEPETTEPDSPILITKLHADGMPMLRYRIGDLGRFPNGSQPGQPVFKMHEVLGRETDRLWLPDGRWVHGLQMPHMMKDYPIKEFRFTQRPDYSIQLTIVPKDLFPREAFMAIRSTVAENLPGIALSIEIVDEIPRTRANKQRPVVSEVHPLPTRLAS
jgi:phenylacetate-CoA ligase